MNVSSAAWLVLLMAAVAANLPFLNERLFLLGPLRQPKSFAWRLLELFAYTALVIAAGVTLEGRLGQVQAQGWAFYAVMACIFLTLGFPGFVWRYLGRSRNG